MIVEQILRSKGGDVFAVLERSTIGEAVNLLSEKNIGAVVVKGADGVVAGILSERDVVRRLKSEGAAVLNAQVGSCMTRNPFTCAPEDPIDDLMATMTEKRIRHIPVLKNGALVGLVSIGDVVKRKIEQIQQEAAALKEYISS